MSACGTSGSVGLPDRPGELVGAPDDGLELGLSYNLYTQSSRRAAHRLHVGCSAPHLTYSDVGGSIPDG